MGETKNRPPRNARPDKEQFMKACNALRPHLPPDYVAQLGKFGDQRYSHAPYSTIWAVLKGKSCNWQILHQLALLAGVSIALPPDVVVVPEYGTILTIFAGAPFVGEHPKGMGVITIGEDTSQAKDCEVVRAAIMSASANNSRIVIHAGYNPHVLAEVWACTLLDALRAQPAAMEYLREAGYLPEMAIAPDAVRVYDFEGGVLLPAALAGGIVPTGDLATLMGKWAKVYETYNLATQSHDV